MTDWKLLFLGPCFPPSTCPAGWAAKGGARGANHGWHRNPFSHMFVLAVWRVTGWGAGPDTPLSCVCTPLPGCRQCIKHCASKQLFAALHPCLRPCNGVLGCHMTPALLSRQCVCVCRAVRCLSLRAVQRAVCRPRFLRRPCPGVCLVLARSTIWALNSLTRSDRGFVGAAISAVGMRFLVAVVVAAGQGSAGLAAAAAGGVCMQAQFVWAWWLSKLALGWVVKASYVWATLTEGSSSSQGSFACAPVAYLHL